MSASSRAWWEGRRILAIAAVLLALVVSAGVITTGTDVEGVLWQVRATARASVVFFVVTFAASAINGLWRSDAGKALLRNRRYLGLSYALSHGVHTSALFWYAHAKGVGFSDLTDTATFIGAMIGNTLIAAMVLTSTDGARRRLGRARWTLLHRAGMYYVFAIFVLSTMVPAWRGDPLGVAVMLALLAALGLRVANRLRMRRSAAA